MRQARLWILFTLIAAAAWCQPGPGTSEFRVNTSRQDAERDPAVAQNAAGEFVVAWRGEDQYSGYLGWFVYPAGIFAQRFDSDGRPQGGELQVNTANMGEYGYGPDVAIDGAGRFLVVWADEHEGTGTFARRYGVDGEPLGEPEKIGPLGFPALAGDEAGNALAVASHPDRSPQAVTGRLFDAAEAAWREPFEIQESFPRQVVPANVALDASGGFVVIWRRDEDVLGRRFTSAGEPREGELVLNQESAPWPYSEADRRASVGADGDGGFVVVWARDEEVGTSLRARRFDAAGEPRGDEVVLDPQGFHESVAVAVDAAGEHLVAWGRAASAGLWLDGAGNARGGVFPVVYNTPSADPGLDLAMTASGRLVVTFVAGDVYARLLPPAARGGVLQLVDEPGGVPWSALVEEELEVSVQVARTGGVAGEVSVEHLTVGGTATPGEDYTSASGRLVFAEGEYLKSFPLAVHEDEDREGPEDLTVVLRDAQGALLRDPSAYTVTLYDDESTLPGEGPYPRGEKRRANQTAGGSTPRPRVAVRPDGSFFVVWSDDPPGAPTDWTVRGRLYDAAGQSVGDEIAVSEEPQVRPPGPSVLATSDGFLVAWTAGRSRVLGRRIEARRGPGETFELARCGANYTCSDTGGTEVAPGDDGSFVVVWAGDYSGSYGADVSFLEAQLFAEDATPIGETAWIEGSWSFWRLGLGLSSRRRGGFLVVWNDNDCNLMSRRLDTAGDGEVHRLGHSCDSTPAVVRPGGEGFVLYNEARLSAPSDAFGGLADTIGLEVTGRNLDAEGAPVGEPFPVNGFSPGDQAGPRASASASGDHVVVWASDDEPGPGRRSIVARLYDAAVRRLGRRFAVRPSDRLQSAPDVAMTPSGDAFVVVWGERNGLGGFDVYAQPYVGSSCLSGQRKLCLNQGRFELRVTWRDFTGRMGEGSAVPVTDDTGAFYFFGPENLELMVKVLDGRRLTGHFWVFYGSLSNVEFTLTVTDTSNGNSKRYVNPLGVFASVGDVRALPGD